MPSPPGTSSPLPIYLLPLALSLFSALQIDHCVFSSFRFLSHTFSLSSVINRKWPISSPTIRSPSSRRPSASSTRTAMVRFPLPLLLFTIYIDMISTRTYFYDYAYVYIYSCLVVCVCRENSVCGLFRSDSDLFHDFL